MEMRTVLFSLFSRYEKMIEQSANLITPSADELSLENCLWMAKRAKLHIDVWPIDKLNRWVGFIQACVVMHGMTTVGIERDITRPLFHSVYTKQGIAIPDTASFK